MRKPLWVLLCVVGLGTSVEAQIPTIPPGGEVHVTDNFSLGRWWPAGDPNLPAAADNGGTNLNVDGGLFTADVLQVASGDAHFEQNPLEPYVKVRVTNGGTIELAATGTCGLSINDCVPNEDESLAFVDVTDGSIQIQGDHRDILNEYRSLGWLGNSVDGWRRLIAPKGRKEKKTVSRANS